MRRASNELLENSLRGVPLAGFEELSGLLPQAAFLCVRVNGSHRTATSAVANGG